MTGSVIGGIGSSTAAAPTPGSAAIADGSAAGGSCISGGSSGMPDGTSMAPPPSPPPPPGPGRPGGVVSVDVGDVVFVVVGVVVFVGGWGDSSVFVVVARLVVLRRLRWRCLSSSVVFDGERPATVSGVPVAPVVAAVPDFWIPARCRLVLVGARSASLLSSLGWSRTAAVGIGLRSLAWHLIRMRTAGNVRRRRGLGNGQSATQTTQEQAGGHEAGRGGAEHTRTHFVTTLQGVTAPAMERSDHSRTNALHGLLWI